MFKLIVSAATVGLLAFSVPAFAASSASRDIVVTQGNSDKSPPNDNAGASSGTKTDSSNKGNPDNTNCNTCGTTGPGNSGK